MKNIEYQNFKDSELRIHIQEDGEQSLNNKTTKIMIINDISIFSTFNKLNSINSNIQNELSTKSSFANNMHSYKTNPHVFNFNKNNQKSNFVILLL